MPFIGSPFAFPPGTMQSAIERLGLTSGLKLCLDASDIASYSGSGQSWLDTSGNGYDFFRGTTSASQSTDPTFNGSAGGQSSAEYWSFDGGDYFTLGQANPSWVDNIHKNNAIFAIVGYIYLDNSDPTNSQPIFGTSINTADVGFSVYVDSTDVLSFAASNGAGGGVTNLSKGTAIGLDGWHFVAVSLNEATGANGAILQVDGSQSLASSTYSSPSSSAAAITVQIGAIVDVDPTYLKSGARMSSLAVWEGVSLSATQLNDVYNATKSKFGL